MPKPLAGQYRMYAQVDDDELIRQSFKKRYGYVPQRIVRTGGCVLAGPIHGGTPMRPGEKVMTGNIKEAR